MPASPTARAPNNRQSDNSGEYRPDIDGLRAIAVLAVLGFHTFPTWVRGGFVGVDVFFVISGYLISTILFAGMERGSFSFLQFYVRRVRRIFPALIVVLLGCIVAGWLLLFSFEYMALGKHVAGSAAFVSNFVLWNEAGYFDKAAETKPLLHIWSLGIEEQFYIVWPLLLYVIWKRKTGALTFLLLVLLGSFVLNVYEAGVDAAADYYSPLTRFWELTAGAILAYLPLRSSVSLLILNKLPPHLLPLTGVIVAQHSAANNVKAVCGLLFITVSIFWLDGKSYPGWWALLPVVGTYLMLEAGHNAWINNKLLATRGLVAIGLISYPLYLWHWPLLSFLRIVNGAAPSPIAAALTIFLSFVLAYLTYLLVEMPLRFGKSAQFKAALLFVVMSVIGTAGYLTYANGGYAFRNPRVEDLVAAAQDFEHADGLTVGNPDAPETLLIGDSTMGQYIPRVQYLIEQHAIDLNRNRIVFYLAGGCLPVPEIAQETNQACARFADDMLVVLNNNAIKTVAFASLWTADFKEAAFYLRNDNSRVHLKDSQSAREQVLAKFASLIVDLIRSGKNVFVILETPTSLVYDPETMLPTGWRRLLGSPRLFDDPKRQDMENLNAVYSKQVQILAKAAGAHVINPMDYLCDERVCPVASDGHFRYYDYDHLRASFVRDRATYIDQIFTPSPGR
jgi:peptidoglycan/LPS O-acetylase OafA/YrhL